MKHILIFCLVFCGIVNANNPISEFTPGAYLGSGTYVASNGTEGNTSSYVVFTTNGWNMIYLKDEALRYYDSALTIDPFGFATVALTDKSDPSNPLVYDGFGNCGDYYCQINVPVSNGVLQQLITFDCGAQSIHFLGSLYTNDGSPNIQWEEISYLIAEDQSPLAPHHVDNFLTTRIYTRSI